MQKNNGNSSSTSSIRVNQKISAKQLNKKFEQLHHQNKKWKARKQKMREERQLAKSLQDEKECTFKPSINPEIVFNGSNNQSFLKRQTDWINKKTKKIEQMSRQYQKKAKKQCSFHPNISQNSYNLLHNPKKSNIYMNKYKNSSDNPEFQNPSIVNAKSKGSYRQIHLKKESLKQLQKTQSVYAFNFFTDKRKNIKIEQDLFDQEANYTLVLQNDSKTISVSQSPMKTMNLDSHQKNFLQKRLEDEQTINSISISTGDQKNERKQVTQSEKQPIQIFEQNEEDELNRKEAQFQQHSQNEYQFSQNPEQKNSQNRKTSQVNEQTNGQQKMLQNDEQDCF